MKLPFNKKYSSISLYAIIIIAVAILLWRVTGSVEGIVSAALKFFSAAKTLLTPFIYGFFIAYFLNPIVRFFEKRLLSQVKFFEKRKGLSRGVAILLTDILVLGLLAWIIVYMFPEVIASINRLINYLQNTINAINSSSQEYLSNNSIEDIIESFNTIFSTNYTLNSLLELVLEPVISIISSIPTLLPKIYQGTLSIANSVLNIALGLIISIYMLVDKERLAGAIKKGFYTILRRKNADRLLAWASDSNKLFESFIVGKTIDSLIIGTLFFICCKIFKIEYYTLLLSIIIGVTNMIPYFGPIIGAVPVIFIVLMFDPVKALWTAVLILVIQQFDGNILGPKILGESTGLRPLGVIFAITVGGALFGVMGMFFGVPVFAVLCNGISAIINRRYDKKYVKVDPLTVEDGTKQVSEE